MDGAKRFKPKGGRRGRGLPANHFGETVLSAEEALDQYYESIHSLELKLKNDLEQQRLRRQGLGINNNDDDSDDADPIVTDQGPTKHMIEGR